MRRFMGGYPGGAEGGLAKILGVVFILIGIYALADLYGFFSIEPITESYVLVGCAIGSILGGLYMIGKSGRRMY